MKVEAAPSLLQLHQIGNGARAKRALQGLVLRVESLAVIMNIADLSECTVHRVYEWCERFSISVQSTSAV